MYQALRLGLKDGKLVQYSLAGISRQIFGPPACGYAMYEHEILARIKH